MNTTEPILNRLLKALDADGDFPTRAKVITEIKELTENPLSPLNKVVDTILSEPSLATRILHIVNSVYYARGNNIENLSQAVVHIGLKSIYNLCANFVVLQRFTPLVKKGGGFYHSFILTMITSYLSSYLDGVSKKDEKEEEGYLAGSLFTIGPLLLGYYFPKLFSDAEKRAERKRISLYKSIEELLGIPAVEVSIEVVDSLSIPPFYKNILSDALSLYKNKELRADYNGRTSSKAVCAATLLAELIVNNTDMNDFLNEVESIAREFNFEKDVLHKGLKNLAVVAEHQSTLLGISSIELPLTLMNFIKGKDLNSSRIVDEGIDNPMTPYLHQLEQAIQENETLASVIATVMEALTFAMNFERVIYLEADVDGSRLNGKLGLGEKLKKYDDLSFKLSDLSFSEDIQIKSFQNKTIETTGVPVFEDAWPYAALPVGYDDRILGVIYADQVETDRGPLETGDTIALSLLADIMDRAIQKNRI